MNLAIPATAPLRARAPPALVTPSQGAPTLVLNLNSLEFGREPLLLIPGRKVRLRLRITT